MSGHVSVWLDLVDSQVVDAEKRPFARIEDVELEVGSGREAPTVTHLLVGAQAFDDRLGGRTGSWIARSAARLRSGEAEGPVRIDATLVEEIEPHVKLRVPLRDLPEAAALERWLAHRLVARIPGAGDPRD